MKENLKKLAGSLLAVVIGNALYALTVTLFLIPSGLVTGGTTGLALAAEHFFSVPVSTFVLIFNVCMLVLGLLILGKNFALTTVASTFLYPLFLRLFEAVLPPQGLTDDLLPCTVFSGLGIGAALGIVIRSGASTGGMDIPPLVLNRLLRIPVSVSMYVFDFAILLVQLLFRPIPNVLYGIVLVLIYTVMLDKMLLIGKKRIELKIISPKKQEITEAILKQVDRGVTLLNGEGGFSHEPTQIILTVISSRELIKVERVVRAIDPESFMVVAQVSEVQGRGFTLSKLYQEK